ncbi:hypothetical protein QBC35DRAFT_74378 [Podospora australis]|uniref:DUF202 domain-containing protein n=1 Tax=Podospora australis TaxID=1536484 RepID=A0AAN6WZL2_9PEZI|nr:hypothetical protein QBC35DRAFT_74378 [Podospora australis]
MTAEDVDQTPVAPTTSSAAAAAPTATTPLPPPQSGSRQPSSSRDLSGRQRSRRRSAQDRINDILEGARQRSESYDHQNSSPGTLSPRLQPLLGSSPRGPNYLSSGSPRIASPRTGSPRRGPSIPEENNGNSGDGGVVTAQPDQQQQHHIHYQPSTQLNHSTRRRSSRRATHDQARAQSDVDEDGLASRSREQEEGRWKKTLRYFKSIELENKGSVARDHLALERTFLAWLRTSLAFASIGIAITQLFRLNTSLADDEHQSNTLRHLGKPLGATFLAISILILFLGYNRYLESQEWVIKGKFPASRGTILLVTFIAFAVTVASLIVVVAVQSSH